MLKYQSKAPWKECFLQSNDFNLIHLVFTFVASYAHTIESVIKMSHIRNRIVSKYDLSIQFKTKDMRFSQNIKYINIIFLTGSADFQTAKSQHQTINFINLCPIYNTIDCGCMWS